jgi:dTDP-glucose 4,6-dehydratase
VVKFPEIHFINLDCITYAGDIFRIESEVLVSPNYTFEKIDIRDKDSIDSIYKKCAPAGTIHFAAETHVDRSITGPDIFLETNIIGTKNLLDAHKNFAS